MVLNKLFTFISLCLLSVSVYADILNLNADYTLPSTKLENKDFAKFELENYRVTTLTNDQALMEFDLPVEMTGEKVTRYQLILKGKIGEQTKVLSGKRAKALCDGPWKSMKCAITFTEFKINQEELRKVLGEKYNPLEAEARYNLLLKFSNDPIGLAVIK